MTANTDINTFFFLHHGTTDWSSQGLLMGQSDLPLNEKGRQAAEDAGKILVRQEIVSLCFSPLARARETAQIIAKHCHCGLYALDGFKDRHWGVLEGQSYLQEQLVAEVPPEGAEERSVFVKRVRDAFASVGSYPAPILIVAHTSILEIICDELELECPIGDQPGIIHFFQRLGRWVAKPLEP